jgi:hypothetical protein
MTITTPPSPVSDAEFFRERGFGLPIGFGARPVLLVVDLTGVLPMRSGRWART